VRRFAHPPHGLAVGLAPPDADRPVQADVQPTIGMPNTSDFATYWIVRGDVAPTTQMSTQCRWLTASTQPPAGIRSLPYMRARVKSFVSGCSHSRENAQAGSP